jgi:hypothetical protein
MSFDDPAWRRKFLRRLQATASSRANRAGMKFDLPPEFALALYDQQDGCCAVSGTKFNLERFDGALVPHPFAPSIDRVLSLGGGYTEDNVRLVCVAVNFGMGQWGQELYMRLARAAVAREAKEQSNPDPSGDGDWYARQREKVDAAMSLRDNASEAEKPLLIRRVASLKRNLTLGPEGLRRAACRARKTRQHPEQEKEKHTVARKRPLSS